jgi:hypothetical protein
MVHLAFQILEDVPSVDIVFEGLIFAFVLEDPCTYICVGRSRADFVDL